MTALERAARAAINAVASEKDFAEGAISMEEEGGLVASYVDVGRVDFMSLALAVLMAVRGEAPTKAMAESRASDDEGDFAPMLDLIDFSGENKLRTVLRQAWIDGIDAILTEKDTTND